MNLDPPIVGEINTEPHSATSTPTSPDNEKENLGAYEGQMVTNQKCILKNYKDWFE